MDRIDIEELDDLAIAQVNELIKEYQKKLAESVKSVNDETNVYIGTFELLTNAETIVDGSLSQSQLQLSTQTFEATASEDANDESEEQVPPTPAFYFECETIDQDGKLTDQGFFANEDIKSLKSSPGVPVGKRLTNQVNLKIENRLSSWVDELVGAKDGKLTLDGKDYNFGIDKCFECRTDFDSAIIFPELNYILDFRNILDQIKQMLEFLKLQLDPTIMVSNVCEFLKLFGDNLLCPSGLLGIQALLPTLFAKYSADLLKFNLDFTVLLGGLVKNLMGNFSSVVNGIKNSLLPYYDCIINLLLGARNYYTTVLESINKVSEESVGLVNKTLETGKKGFDLLFEEDKDDLEKQLKNLKARQESYKRGTSYDGYGLDFREFPPEHQEIIQRFINNFDPLDESLVLKTDDEIFNEFSVFVNKRPASIRQSFRKYQKNYNESDGDFKSLGMVLSTDGHRVISNRQQKALKKLNRTSGELDKAISKTSNELKAVSAKPETSRDSNLRISEYDKGYARRDVYPWGFDKSRGETELLNAREQKGQLPRGKIYETVVNQYNINLSDRYFRSKDYIPYKGTRYNKALDTSKPKDDRVLATIDNAIKHLRDGREWSLDHIKKINNTFSAIGSYTSESLNAAAKINGEMLSLIHLIRAIKVVYNLIRIAGDLTCKDVLKDPTKLSTFNGFFNDLDIKLSEKGDALLIEEQINGDIDLSAMSNTRKLTEEECSSIQKAFTLDDNMLNKIYEEVENVYWRN